MVAVVRWRCQGAISRLPSLHRPVPFFLTSFLLLLLLLLPLGHAWTRQPRGCLHGRPISQRQTGSFPTCLPRLLTSTEFLPLISRAPSLSDGFDLISRSDFNSPHKVIRLDTGWQREGSLRAAQAVELGHSPSRLPTAFVVFVVVSTSFDPARATVPGGRRHGDVLASLCSVLSSFAPAEGHILICVAVPPSCPWKGMTMGGCVTSTASSPFLFSTVPHSSHSVSTPWVPDDAAPERARRSPGASTISGGGFGLAGSEHTISTAWANASCASTIQTAKCAPTERRPDGAFRRICEDFDDIHSDRSHPQLSNRTRSTRDQARIKNKSGWCSVVTQLVTLGRLPRLSSQDWVGSVRWVEGFDHWPRPHVGHHSALDATCQLQISIAGRREA
ncbi:hypothetical protein LZ30DRAFT_145222 [Colletotrichum cereale]|nr:hypothetical protein LZ30DRAFT_145222 [Colletotrichum cereale]